MGLRSSGASKSILIVIRLVAALCALLLADVREVVAKPYDPNLDHAYRGWTVTSFALLGIESDLAQKMTNGLVLSGQTRLLGTERAKFFPDPLADDILRVRLFLARRGYPEAVVTANVVPNPTNRTIDLELIVESGPAVMISQVKLLGVPRDQKAEAQLRVPLKAGQRFDEDAIDSAAEAVRRLLATEGYARATVQAVVEDTAGRARGAASEEVEARPSEPRVSVRFEVHPGPLCSFGGVDVAGVEGDLVPLAKRTLGLRRGMRYSPSRVQSAEDRIRSLDLFRQVNIDVEDAAGFDPAAPRGTVDVTCHLIEQPQQRVATGLGYRTDEQVRAHARWEHRNLFRRGRGVRVSGLYSSLRRNVRTGFWWPALFKVDVRAELTGRFEWLREEGFDSNVRGARLSFGYRPSFSTTYDIGVELLQSEIDAKSDFEETYLREATQLELSTDWTHNNANDRLDPSGGSSSWIQLRTVIPTALSGSRFVAVEAAHSYYFQPIERVVVATRVRTGWARPWGKTTDLAPNNRFFAGGITSMRGFRRSRLGPVDPDGTPLGGEVKLEAGLEMRFPIWKAFRGAAFVDLGQVWADRSGLRLDELEVAVGPSLILSTPIGPIRADVGFRLTDFVSQQPGEAYHIAIGHPF